MNYFPFNKICPESKYHRNPVWGKLEAFIVFGYDCCDWLKCFHPWAPLNEECFPDISSSSSSSVFSNIAISIPLFTSAVQSYIVLQWYLTLEETRRTTGSLLRRHSRSNSHSESRQLCVPRMFSTAFITRSNKRRPSFPEVV